jgi:hypothetical protein
MRPGMAAVRLLVDRHGFAVSSADCVHLLTSSIIRTAMHSVMAACGLIATRLLAALAISKILKVDRF